MSLNLKNKKGEEMEHKDISTIKGAVQAPSFGNSPEGLPPGLEDAPSPTPKEMIKKEDPEEKRGMAIKDLSTPLKQQPQQTGTIMPVKNPEPTAERASFDVIEEIAEAVISEKWDDLVRGVGDLRLWKEKIDTDLAGVKQEILRTQTRFENLQTAIMGKVSEYGEGVTEISAELKALEKVMEKIINPLTKSVKDLQKITDKIK